MSGHRRHVARWVETHRFFRPPVNRDIEIARPTRDVVERILHGFTTIESRCEVCGEVDTRIALGDLTRNPNAEVGAHD